MFKNVDKKINHTRAASIFLIGAIIIITVLVLLKKKYGVVDLPPLNHIPRASTLTTTDFLMRYTIKPDMPTGIGSSWYINLLEIDKDNNKCKILLFNQAEDQQNVFWISESEFVKGLEYFGRYGLKILKVNENSVTIELRSSEVKMEGQKNKTGDGWPLQ